MVEFKKEDTNPQNEPGAVPICHTEFSKISRLKLVAYSLGMSRPGFSNAFTVGLSLSNASSKLPTVLPGTVHNKQVGKNKKIIYFGLLH